MQQETRVNVLNPPNVASGEAAASALGATAFTLAIEGSTDRIRVTRFNGQERMNDVYAFDVSLTVAAGVAPLGRTAIQQRASLQMHFAGATARAVHGIVASAAILGVDAFGATLQAVRIVPRLTLLMKRRSSRIFQDATTRDIVDHVLALSGVRGRWALSRELQRRPYCVQYDETDYAFVTRLRASEGVFFFFEHDPLATLAAEGAPLEVVVFSDAPAGYSSIAGSRALRFRGDALESGGSLEHEEDHVTAFRVTHGLATERVLLRRYDFARPLTPHRDAASVDGARLLAGRESLDRDGMRAFVDEGLTVYEHQNSREQALVEPVEAKTVLDSETADSVVATGETASRRLLPGHRFDLMDHPSEGVDGDYVVTSMSHEGANPASAKDGEPIYRGRFSSVPASVAYRAQRPTRAVRQAFETATVVGPPNQEIYTDIYGRVKVQFHWDLEGKFDDKSSAWLRVAQAWAGGGYGVQFVPRVGHEVLVGYLDGDTDRPVVVASLHNGRQPPPVRLPERQTQSGLFSSSTPTGAGGNSLLFDDQLGAEVVALRSSRTLELAATENATLSANDQLTVAAGANMITRAGADSHAQIDGASSTVVGKARKSVVGEDDTTLIGGAREVEVGSDDALRVGGNVQRTYAGQRTTVVGADPTLPGDDRLGVAGRYRLGSVGDMRITSETSIELFCGKSKILITPDAIILDAPTIQLQASDRISLVQGKGAAALTLAGSASLGGGTVACVAGGKGGGARLFLDAEAHLDGALVKLNCGPLGAAGGTPVDENRPQGTVTFLLEKSAVPPGITELTLRIATPTGEIVERICPVGGTVEMTGYVGDVFTIVEGLVGEDRIPLAAMSAPVPPKT